MPSLINSDDGVVSGSAGLKTTGSNDGILALQNNGTTNVTVTAAGNVGIGTTSPSVLLDVYGTGSVLGEFIRNNTGSASGGVTIGNNSGTFSIFADTAFSIYDNQAAASRAAITSTGLFQFNSGYGSVATAYGCRAWVNFNGTGTVAIRASGNVTSITDNGVGDYTVNFTTAMPDANYSIVGATSMLFGVNYNGAVSINTVNSTAAESAPTTSACRVAIRNSSATAIDVAYFNVAIFR